MYTCEVVLKTAQETGESGGIIRNHWEIGRIQGKFRGNWGKIGEMCFPLGKQNSMAGKSIPPTSGKKGENEGKLFPKIPIWGIFMKQVGEMKGK